MLERALRVIPLGAQTFSKSYTQYPRGSAPFFIERAMGSRAWDVDGHEYIDFNNALCSVTLGHCDPDVSRSVSDQLQKGTIFSLSNELEIEVAEKIAELVPCADQVRFGKNGSDATAGAIRAARAFTGRDRVAVCGYHGWQDWYIGSTLRNKGVPQVTSQLTHGFRYNDIASLEAVLAQHPGEFAAVILEPMNTTLPQQNFLGDVCEVGRRAGALIVFDETISGFRYATGGAQEYFGVTPDLACFGKGLANGYPLSAVAGRRDVMKEFEDVFFSFTMGGETLSLAAAKAALAKIVDQDVPSVLHARGQELARLVNARIASHGCEDLLSITGHPSWTFLAIGGDPERQFPLKTLMMQETLARGILSVGTHNMSFAHAEDDIGVLIDVYDQVFPLLREAYDTNSILERLRCEPLQPLFRIR